MRVATGEMNWWPEAFPRRAAFAAVGLASRDYFSASNPQQPKALPSRSAARESALENSEQEPPPPPPSLHVKTLEQQPPPPSLPPKLDDLHHDQQPQQPPPTFTAHKCWQCGALQQPGGYPQVAPHLPSPLSSARREHLDTVKSHLCSSVDHHQPEQPVSLPGAPQPQFDNEAELARVAQFQEHFRELDQALTALQPLPGPPAQPTGTPLRLFNRFAVLDLESAALQPCSLGAVLHEGIIEQPADSHILGAMVLARMKTLNQTGTCGKAGGQRLADLQAKANLARLVPPEVKEQRRVTAFAKASGMDRAAVAQAASEYATTLTTDPTGRLLYFTERLDQRGNPGISQAQFDGVRQAWHDYTKPSPSVKDLCQFSERMVAGLKSLVPVHVRCANAHVKAEGCDHAVNYVYPESLGRNRQLPTPEDLQPPALALDPTPPRPHELEEAVEEPLPADPDLEQVPGGIDMDVEAAERAFDLKCVPGQDGGRWSKRPQGHFKYDPSLPGADRARLAKLLTDLQAKQVAHHASDAHTTAMLELLASTSTMPNIPASASAMRSAMEELGQPQEEYLVYDMCPCGHIYRGPLAQHADSCRCCSKPRTSALELKYRPVRKWLQRMYAYPALAEQLTLWRERMLHVCWVCRRGKVGTQCSDLPFLQEVWGSFN
ncbi:hypothetical protein V8C86DRAFT_2438835 [Haematococcus lacustris]